MLPTVRTRHLACMVFLFLVGFLYTFESFRSPSSTSGFGSARFRNNLTRLSRPWFGSGHRSRLHTKAKPPIIAFVGVGEPSRTEILDCYLQANLVENGGILHEIFFALESKNATIIAYLRQLVADTSGYSLIVTPEASDPEQDLSLDEKAITISDEYIPSTALGRSWLLAEQLARKWNDTTKPEPLFLFINAETIFISPIAIPSMVSTLQNRPEYAIAQANMVNQQVLTWLHMKMGTIRPYRPESKSETEKLFPPAGKKMDVYKLLTEEVPEGQDEDEGPDEVAPGYITKRAEAPGLETEEPSWRASALPLWHTAALEPDHSPQSKGPSIFGVQIEQKPSNRKQRWLPFDDRVSSATDASSDQHRDIRSRTPLRTPMSQHVLSENGPGQWPWTLSVQQLYSFLEILEEEEEVKTTVMTHTETVVTGLDRYRFPTYAFGSDPISPSMFLLSASTLLSLAPFPYDASESDLADWIVNPDIVDGRLHGRGAVVDGSAVAARFLPNTVGKSRHPTQWMDGETVAEEIRMGIEGTDLLERFAAYTEETCWGRL